jgi:hypothetical protein
MRFPRAIEQADGDRAGEQTDGGAKRDQPPVVLGGEAIQDLIHYRPLYPPVTTGPFSSFPVTARGFVPPMVNKALHVLEMLRGAALYGPRGRNCPEIPGTGSPPKS